MQPIRWRTAINCYLYLGCVLLIFAVRRTVSIRVDSENVEPLEDKEFNDEVPEKAEEDIEAEKKHFMDAYSLLSGPKQLEFGHVFEDPKVWEQRYEKKDFDDHRYQGKVKWGDKDGGYGEHYWDFNHGGAGESTPYYDDGEEPEGNGHLEQHRSPYPAYPQGETEDGDHLEQYNMSPYPEYAQESRHKAVVYEPLVLTLVKTNQMIKKPNRNIRSNYSKRVPPVADTAMLPARVNANDKKSAPVLVFDMKTGVVLDEATGNKYTLRPLNDN
ncbi:uncharacterized protein LOC126840278 [Adelges cooleyi]|uniref:uncharacterized protein LOC126840278 n=1 Tax=Adelges cooleyi TaxID=133065 RepID=UPI0021801595|nr:uncharacterized protein LOC126840278 [Adelges cooleyi]